MKPIKAVIEFFEDLIEFLSKLEKNIVNYNYLAVQKTEFSFSTLFVVVSNSLSCLKIV